MPQQPKFEGNTFLIPDGSSLLAYNPYTGAITRLLNTYLLTDDNRRDLKTAGFLGESPTCTRANQSWKGFGSLTLLLTRRCNLQCLYCYASARPDGPSMPIQLALDAIQFYESHAIGDRLRVCFHGGGEPTLVMDTVRAATQLVNDIRGNRRTTFLITTNGTACEQDMAWMMENNFNISVSFDGPPDVQNRNRPFVDGLPSSNAVEVTLKLMVMRRYPFTVRLSFSETDDITRILEYLSALGVTKVHLEPIFPYGRHFSSVRFGQLSENISAPGSRAMTRQFMIAIAACDRLDMTIHNSHLVNLTSGTGYFCGSASGRSMVVTHDGILTGCLEVIDANDSDMGSFRTGNWDHASHTFDLDVNQQKRFINRHADTIEPCKDCFARYTCAGGCAVKAVRQGGEFSSRDLQYCGFTRTIVPEIVRRIAQLSGV